MQPAPKDALVRFAHFVTGDTSVAGGQRDMDAFLREHVADILEPLILGNRDRPAVAFALDLARRVLRVGHHHLLDLITDGYHNPGPLSEVVHEDVVAFLWVLP